MVNLSFTCLGADLAQISLLAVACSVFTFTPAFKTQSRFIRPMRAALFGGFALSAIVPIIHSIALWGWEAQNYRISLGYILGVMSFNTAGAVAYATKVSHQPGTSKTAG